LSANKNLQVFKVTAMMYPGVKRNVTNDDLNILEYSSNSKGIYPIAIP